MGADPDLTPVGLARMSGCAEHQAGRNCPVHGVRKMADRWWIHVCPECNGLVGERTQTHNETCPNRHGGYFVPRDVEVVPASKINVPAGREGLRLDLEDA